MSESNFRKKVLEKMTERAKEIGWKMEEVPGGFYKFKTERWSHGKAKFVVPFHGCIRMFLDDILYSATATTEEDVEDLVGALTSLWNEIYENAISVKDDDRPIASLIRAKIFIDKLTEQEAKSFLLKETKHYWEAPMSQEKIRAIFENL